MASGSGVWGIDIGQCALKAIKLRPGDDGKLEVVAFDIIEHPKILSQPDADRDELIKGALEKFASRNDWQRDKVIFGVPGQQTFSRFTKLPPADPKKINDLVKYEAGQQIPFDMDDVVWDYQTFVAEGSPDIEVGIFAIRKDIIRKQLDYFSTVRIAPAGVQTIPSSLYNFSLFDKQIAENGATVLVDVGAQATDLIIVEPNSAWTRNIPLGGNSFTEALVRSFKLSFAKAESLKRTAASSKYARQIFQAMRPVFAELVAEIQRSIGFYSSTHRDMELTKVVALGNAFRLPGLQKYLENNLTISNVVKLEKFNELQPSATINAPQFTENILSFGAAYGLALQGLGMAKITASLLPPELARIAVWKKKQPYFAATAAVVALGSFVPMMFNQMAETALGGSPEARDKTKQITNEASKFRDEYNAARTDTGDKQKDIESLLSLQANRRVVPYLIALPNEALPPLRQPELADARTREEMVNLIKSNSAKFPRTDRGLFLVEKIQMEYSPEVDTAVMGEMGESASEEFDEGGGGGGPTGDGPMMGGRGRQFAPAAAGGGGGNTAAKAAAKAADAKPGFIVRVRGRLLYGNSETEAVKWLTGEYLQNLKSLGQRAGIGFYIPDDDPQAKDTSTHFIQPGRVRRATQRTQALLAGGGGRNPRGGAADGAAAADGPPEAIDPITGESNANDWILDFGFKVKLGEMPKKEGDDKDKTKDKPADKPADKP